MLTAIAHLPPANSGKNVSSSFAKADSQSWYARRPSEQERDALHDAKRRRLVGDEGDAQPTASVLTAAPEGAVRPPRAKPAIEVRPRRVLRVARHADNPTLTTDAQKDAETAAADPLSHTLVIHPGSRWLRIGLASSLAPVAVPNVIARKVRGTVPGMNTSKGKERATDTSTSAAGSAPAASALAGAALPPLPAAANGDTAMAEAADDDDDEGWDSSSSSSSRKRRPAGVDAPGASATDPLSAKIQSIRGDLRARMRAYKLRGQGNGNSQAATYNATVVPQAMEEDFEGDIEWTTAEDEVHVGNKVRLLPRSMLAKCAISLRPGLQRAGGADPRRGRGGVRPPLAVPARGLQHGAVQYAARAARRRTGHLHGRAPRRARHCRRGIQGAPVLRLFLASGWRS